MLIFFAMLALQFSALNSISVWQGIARKFADPNAGRSISGNSSSPPPYSNSPYAPRPVGGRKTGISAPSGVGLDKWRGYFK
ncbi:unnamed protein product [Caenorhabditis bovis]|uniref:Uncharacterized protein n=1 Tax=Caenorhabditis bovis TaxID=2654633 RepID=A0A8S1EP07_9PELO|nr:unnamed protein product [Caenorhabditis bovis]